KMSRHEHISDLRGHIIAVGVAGEFITSNLFLDKTIEWFVRIERTNHVVAVFPRRWTVGIGAEIAVGISVSSDIKPMPSPPFAVLRRGKKSFDQVCIGIGATIG